MIIPENYYDRGAWLFCVLYVILIVYLGPWIHPIEDPLGPEIDAYLDRIDELRAGTIPKDPFRPLFYTLLSAAAAELLDDSFRGARVVSAVSGGMTILAAYYLGGILFGRKAGLFGAVLVGTNRHILQACFLAATDITFCAMVTLTLLFQVKFIRNESYRRIVPVSLFFSLACFTRYLGVALLPILAGGHVLNGNRPLKSRLVVLVLFTAGALLFLIPHFTFQTLAFGDPFHNENWRNLVFKMEGIQNTNVLNEADAGSFWNVLSESPAEVFRSFADETRKMVFYNFMNLNGRSTAGAFFTVLLVLGAFQLLPTRDAALLSILSFIGFYLIFLCFFFFFETRFALPIVPCSYLIIANYVLGSAFTERFHLGGTSLSKGSVLAGLVFVLNLHASRDDMRAFRDRHPVEELEAAIQLQKDFGKDLVLVGTYWATPRYVDYRFHYIPSTYDKPEHDVAAYLNRHRQAMRDFGATHLLVGKKTLLKRPPGLVSGRGMPRNFRIIKQTEFVTLYRITAN